MKPNLAARSVISRVEYATVATVSAQGDPWNAPVYYAYDEDFNFYWGSHTGSQHSQNIRANGRGFLAIYNSTVRPGTGEGVYVKVRCVELTNPTEIARAHKLIQDRRNPIAYWKLEQFHPGSPISLYKATPEKIWMNNDARVDDTYIDIRSEALA